MLLAVPADEDELFRAPVRARVTLAIVDSSAPKEVRRPRMACTCTDERPEGLIVGAGVGLRAGEVMTGPTIGEIAPEEEVTGAGVEDAGQAEVVKVASVPYAVPMELVA